MKLHLQNNTIKAFASTRAGNFHAHMLINAYTDLPLKYKVEINIPFFCRFRSFRKAQISKDHLPKPHDLQQFDIDQPNDRHLRGKT